jgi:cytochrome b561
MNASRARSTMPTTGAGRYDALAMAFHWITVVLVVAVGVMGLLHDSWPKTTQRFWINVHALLGLLLWVLVMVRLGWRRQHTPPVLPAEAGELARRVAGPVHGLLYVLMLVIPIFGIVTFIWHGRVFDFGLFQVNFGVRSDRAIFHPTEDIHGYLAYALFGLIGIHVLAALWHHFFRRDGLLRRMWPSSVRH